MNFAAAALLGLTLGQPIGQDYHAMNSRNIKLPIKYEKDRRTIRQVTLYVARNGENTWYQEGFVTPDKDAFVYVAKEDGLYWFKMQIEDLKGNKDPADLTRDPPDLKMVIDTTKPAVRVTNAKRTGDEIVIEWAIEDKFPNDDATRVEFRATNGLDTEWRKVDGGSRSGVRFPSGIKDSVTVRITAVDIAGNRSEITREFPAGNADATTALSSPAPLAPAPTNTLPADPRNTALVPPAADAFPSAPPRIGPNPGVLPVEPIAPLPPGPLPAQTGALAPYQPPASGSTAATVPSNPPGGNSPLPNYSQPGAPLVSNPPATEGPKQVATFDPKAAPPAHAATPAAAWTSPTVEMTRAQVINFTRFDLGFDLEKRGPSGISRVDLWLTRDEGRSWQKWSEHDGKGGAVRVVLDDKANAQLEGTYGFRLVPVSGANRSEGKPEPGSAPDMRVVLDVTPPKVVLSKPDPDPNAPDTIVIKWEATDRNFGDDPITLEYSDSPAGPWKPVATAGTDPVVQATALNAPVAKRLANTGQYSWRVPVGVPARVHLKITARDAAGNVTERVTVEPMVVDLTTPRAKISGIVPPPVVTRP
ncbi:MAG TPA: hypothetical protein VGE74_01420 [Gemmata sp.]